MIFFKNWKMATSVTFHYHSLLDIMLVSSTLMEVSHKDLLSLMPTILSFVELVTRVYSI
jgi:hypothetical protein